MLTGFQLRAALGALKIDNITFSKIISISTVTLQKLKKTSDHEFIKCHTSTLHLLEEFFKKSQLRFAHNTEISLTLDKNIYKSFKKLTVFQVRASRAILKLSLNKLSSLINISHNTLFKIEQGNITAHITENEHILNSLRDFYTTHKIFYPDDFSITLDK